MSDVLLGVIIGGAITGVISIAGQCLANRHARNVEKERLKHEKQMSKASFMEKRMEDSINVAINFARSAWVVRADPSNLDFVKDHIGWWLQSWRIYGELGMFLEREDVEEYLKLIEVMAELDSTLLFNDGSPEKIEAFRIAIKPVREKADELSKHFRKHFEI